MDGVIDLKEERAKREQIANDIQAEIDQIDKLLNDKDSPPTDKGKLRLMSQRRVLVKSLTKKEEKTTNTDIDDLEDDIKNAVKEWLAENDLYFVIKNSRYWMHFHAHYDGDTFVPAQWTPMRNTDLKNLNPDIVPQQDNPYWRAFVEIMQDGRHFRDITHSFNKVPGTTLNMLSHHFLQPEKGEPHWLFGELLNSLSGGKPENRDHIEQTIIAAYLKPEDNFLRPCQVFDDEGTTGKTLFATRVLGTLFGRDLVVPSVNIEALDHFNAHIIGKVVVFINEVTQDEHHANILRRILGSQQMKLEFKGIDATFVDNTPLYFISGNNFGVGAVHFTDKGSDRRYSMHCPKKKLWTYIAPHLTDEDVLDQGKTEEPVLSWIRRVGQNILCDPVQVAFWIGSLIEKHGEITDVAPLHGDDYKLILDGQKSVQERVFERIFNDPDFTYIKRKTLFDFFKSEKPNSKMNNGSFYCQADDWLAKHKKRIELRKTIHWQTKHDSTWNREAAQMEHPITVTTADVYCNSSLTATTLENNDKHYRTKEYGKFDWKVDLPS